MTDQPKPFDVAHIRALALDIGTHDIGSVQNWLLEACDEIERLRARVKKLERLLRACTAVDEGHVGCHSNGCRCDFRERWIEYREALAACDGDNSSGGTEGEK